MDADIELEIEDDHPLALELSSLRTTVARFQHEAHTSALKLQRHSLEAALAIERAQALEHENAAAHEELAVLRAYPDTTPHPAELQLPELTLALRRASDKLTLAEDSLRTRLAQLADMQGAAARAHHAAENAFALAAGARAREEDTMARERALMLQLRAAEEESRMTDRAVREYADLVRTLERRQSSLSSSSSSSPPPPPPPAGSRVSNGRSRSGTFEALQEEKAGLHKLAGEFAAENEALRDEIGRLQVDLEGTQAELEAERKAAEEEHVQLSNALTELERLKHDDSAAAKMVSRYMYVYLSPRPIVLHTSPPSHRKFSQATADTLQGALESLNARHAATTSTLHVQLASAQAALATERRQSARLRDVLDEATEQLARETYGRRREIALRLAVVGREDQLAEALRRWVRRTQETRAREDVPTEQRLDSIVGDAGELLALVDGAAPLPDGAPGIGVGSVARIVVAEDAVKALVEELQVETERRMQLERLVGRADVDEDGSIVSRPLPELPTPSSATRSPNVVAVTIPEVVKVDAATSPICSSPPQASVGVGEASSGSAPLDPPASELPAISPLMKVTPLEHEPATATVLHQPSPQFPDISLEPITSEPDTTKPPSPPTSSVSQPPCQNNSTSLAELGKAKNRYDELQRAFRDCHLALRELGQTLEALGPSSSLPTSALQTILSRLDDFNEDARVELEIRIADEERISRGYATLLVVPGAIASAEEARDVERAVRAFVDGSDAGVARAQSQFARKRDDLEHDIAALKRAVHELSQPQPQAQAAAGASLPSSRPPTPAVAPAPAAAAANASSWTSLAGLGLFAAGGSSSSRPASPSPTFGSVVTSPRPRRPVPLEGGGAAGTGTGGLAALQQLLRIPMPELHHHHHRLHAPPSPSAGQRTRTTSGMYMLGLGMRGSGVGPGESRKMSMSPRPTGLATRVQGGGALDGDDIE
ncbi:hypothetical protein BJV78DRAFT_1285140 [Lactifluus subvellereus]|nr:hypothetical protein BJV78DRAFT_1285140 [Lactifluus subvellereus]